MRILFPKILSGLLIVVLISCEDDTDKDGSGQRAVVQFQNAEQIISEGSNDDVTVLLALDRPSPSAGTITLKIKEDMQHRILTTPSHAGGTLSLPVVKGVRQLQFGVKTVDNTEAEGDQTMMISLEPSPGFTLGDHRTFQLVIQDNDITSDPVPVQSLASFEEQLETVPENHGEPVAYKILLSPAAATDSKVVIAITSDNADAFLTYPSVENNSITLSAPAGTTELSFTMQTINNELYDGNTDIEFSIVSTEGSVVKGARIKQKLTITDDELTGKLKGYESTGGDGGEKRTYEYDIEGRIARIIRETNAPHNPITTTDTYFYDEQDRVIKINKWLGRDIIYMWNNNRIERAEVFQDGTLIQYANYAYDDHGNMAGVEPFYKQSDGAFFAAGVSVYLYFTDGNIYKVLTYNNVKDKEPVLITTRTYEQYLGIAAPIAMFDVLPNVKVQKNLVGSYRYEQHSANLDATYTITYEFREDGQPSKRIASAPGDTQIVLYHYY